MEDINQRSDGCSKTNYGSMTAGGGKSWCKWQ
jgi:hypothetical protein